MWKRLKRYVVLNCLFVLYQINSKSVKTPTSTSILCQTCLLRQAGIPDRANKNVAF